MSVNLTKYPTKMVNRIFQIAGLAVFIPSYVYNYRLITRIMSVEVLTKLLSSFDVGYFRNIIASIHLKGNIDILFSTYVLNSISITGFMFFMFSLTLSIARTINKNGFIRNFSFACPGFVVVIGFFDIFSSFIFLYIAKNITKITAWMVYLVDLCYIVRMVMLYIVMLWIVFVSLYLLVQKVGGGKSNKPLRSQSGRVAENRVCSVLR